MVLLLVAGVFFGSLVRSYWRLNFFCLSSFLASSAGLSHGKTDFGFLVLGFLGQKEFLAVVFWICTFEAVLLEGQ